MLIQQFLITLTLPVVFLLLARYARLGSSRRSKQAWAAALLAVALWSSSILSFYTGSGFPREAEVAWRAAGRYILSMSALLVLVTTHRFLQTPLSAVRPGLVIAVLLGLVSFVLDPVLTPLGDILLSAVGTQLPPSVLWSALWVATWLVPLAGALLLTRQAAQQTPRSLYRNRLNYWQLTLLVYLLGGGVALVQQPYQPAWQEVGALILIGAAMLGNATLRRYDLPELRPTLRHLVARLASTLLLFGLAWTALWLMVRVLPQRTGIATSLDLILFAALFAALFVLTNRLVERGVRWYLLPRRPQPYLALSHGTDLMQSLPDPEKLAGLILRLVQETLGTEHGHLFGVENGPGGSLLLTPLASVPETARPPAALLAGASPFARYLQQEIHGPLATFDLAQGELFGAVPAVEKEAVAGWQSEWLLPLQVGQRLVGVVALGDKFTGAPYYEHELAWLQKLALQAGPLLWQAGQIATLSQLNGYVFERVDSLTLEQQFLQELSALYRQFAALVSPALYAPFGEINDALRAVGPQEELSGTLSQPLTELRTMIGHLVNVAGRVQQQQEFHFAPLHLNDAVQQAVRNLAPMATARRVRVEVDDDPRLPVIKGDEERLTEAIQHLLHNAIKFNKIGGDVRVDSGMAGNELYLHIRDTGVGIPPERSDQVWEAVGHRQNGRYRSSEGVGLLLARFIVRAHGGRLEMNSEYGAGTTFSIFLPLALES